MRNKTKMKIARPHETTYALPCFQASSGKLGRIPEPSNNYGFAASDELVAFELLAGCLVLIERSVTLSSFDHSVKYMRCSAQA